jgi:hypothetical protein
MEIVIDPGVPTRAQRLGRGRAARGSMTHYSPSGYTSTTARSSRACCATTSPRPGRSAPTNAAPFGYRAGRPTMPSSIAASNRSDARTLPGVRELLGKAIIGGSHPSRPAKFARSSHLVPEGITAPAPSGGFLRRRQLLRLAQQTPSSPLLRASSLVMGHADKIQQFDGAS